MLWDRIKTVVLQTSEDTLGFSTKQNKDWFNENNLEVQELLLKKRSAHKAHLAQSSCLFKKAAFRLECSTLQRKLREIQNEWLTNLAVRTQLCADTGDYRGFYEALKVVYGPSYQTLSPLRSADGKELLTEKDSTLNCWSGHFYTLFNASRSVQEPAIDRVLQQPVKTELDVAPTLQETEEAIKQLKSGKAAGVDTIPPEVWKNGGPALHTKLHKFFVCCWEQTPLRPQTKGEKSDCSNYRGITLLSIAGKILARVLLNRLVPAIAEPHLPETQCGFKANPGNHRHGVCPEADSGEAPGTKKSAVHHLRGSDKSIRYREQAGTLENSGKARLPTKVPHHDHTVP